MLAQSYKTKKLVVSLGTAVFFVPPNFAPDKNHRQQQKRAVRQQQLALRGSERKSSPCRTAAKIRGHLILS